MQKLCPLVLSVARGPKALLKTSGAIFPNTDWPRLINDKFEFYLKLNERFAKRTRITSLFCSPFTFQNFRANSLQSYLLFWWPSCYRGNRYVGVNFQKFDSCIVPEVFLLLNDTSIWRLSTWLKDYCYVHIYIYSTRLWTIFTKFITVPHVLLQRVTGITKWGDYYKVIKKVGFSLPSIFSQLTDSDRSLGYGVFAYRAELIFSPIRMKYSLYSPGPNVLDEVTLGSWSRIKMVFTTRSKLASLLFVLGLTAFLFCISYKAEIRKGNSKSRNNNRRIGKLMSWKWFTAFDARQVNYRLIMPSEFQ